MHWCIVMPFAVPGLLLYGHWNCQEEGWEQVFGVDWTRHMLWLGGVGPSATSTRIFHGQKVWNDLYTYFVIPRRGKLQGTLNNACTCGAELRGHLFTAGSCSWTADSPTAGNTVRVSVLTLLYQEQWKARRRLPGFARSSFWLEQYKDPD